MPFAIIRITSRAVGQGGFVVTLIEENGRETQAVLFETNLTMGRWTANLLDARPVPPSDIVTRFSGVDLADRDHPDFAVIAQALFDWLIPPGEVRQRWTDLDNTSQPSLYVDIRVGGLAQLPWELACSSVGARRRPALINGLYRQIARQPSAAVTCSAWPFRILIVVGCSEADEAALGVAAEVAEIER